MKDGRLERWLLWPLIPFATVLVCWKIALLAQVVSIGPD